MTKSCALLINHLTSRKTTTSFFQRCSISRAFQFIEYGRNDRATRLVVAVRKFVVVTAKPGKRVQKRRGQHSWIISDSLERMAWPTNGLHFPAICIRRSKRQHHSGSHSSSRTTGKAVSICRSRWPPVHVYRLTEIFNVSMFPVLATRLSLFIVLPSTVKVRWK